MKSGFCLLALITFFLFSASSFAQIPNAPTNLKTIYVFTNAINIKWDDNSSNENGFVIERSLDGFLWTQRDRVTADNTDYFDVGLMTNTKYYYRVYAYNSYGNSAYSNVINAVPYLPFLCSIGSDTVSVPYPFYTTFTDSRTQMLYKRSEMVGICNVGYIWAIGYYYNGTAVMNLSSCTIKMKNTTDSVITGFNSTGWTTVYNGPLSFTHQGWNTFNLSPSFTADITKNLLVEVCFHSPTSLATNIILRSSFSQNRVWHNHKMGSNGCSLDSGSVFQYRPNLQLQTIIDGVKKINENNPDKYSLEQNYPNPFNGETKFKFNIKNYGPVSLSIFDVLGRQEVVVFSEPLAPGEYEKIFSISNHPLASGIYYYCLNAGDYIKVKKLVILK